MPEASNNIYISENFLDKLGMIYKDPLRVFCDEPRRSCEGHDYDIWGLFYDFDGLFLVLMMQEREMMHMMKYVDITVR